MLRIVNNLKMNHRGLSLAEVIVALGIFSLLVLAIAWIMISALRSNTIIMDQLSGQSDGRRAVEEIINDVRRADASSIGAYAIETAATNTLAFYANIDTDNYRERVRYWLATTTLYKGVTKPSGNPLQYVTSTERVQTIASSIVNQSTNQPVFLYYDELYTGTQAALTQPVSTTVVRLIKVQLEIEKNPLNSPVPLHVESTMQIRSLKLN